ncbi:type VI secretion system protein TssA [Pseudomonas bharatica]|uniref:type VI secretion system protein TssA n=1 Tax=Pseudomonas TaxID=286 RepID=UPI003B28076B
MSLVKQLPPLDLKALLAALDERQPAGTFDAENPLFQDIDQEMVKLGGLQERTIDWEFVDQGARRYLTDHCKHFRIAGHLITAHLRTNSWRGWAEATSVLAAMVEKYWEAGHPKPGPTGYAGKRRLVGQYLERLGDALPHLDRKGYDEDFRKSAQHALDSLQASAPLSGLDVPQLSRLESTLRRYAESTRAPEQAKQPQPASVEPLADAFFAPVLASPENEREYRRSLLSAAEAINLKDAFDPTGYLLRRFALWAHLTQAPYAHNDNRTALMATPLEITDTYEKALANNSIDPPLLQRIERSVAASPYWLRGSFLSASVARKLDMPRVAEAIRQACERLVTRLPALTSLAFVDGRALLDDDTQAWLSGSAENVGASFDPEYPALRDELATLLDSAGVEPMLRSLESLQQQKSEPRHACHLMTIAAQLLASRGLNWLAEGLYARARCVMDSTSIRAWEPQLHALLVRHTPAGEEQKH